MDGYMKRMESEKEWFAFQIILYYCIFEIMPFCSIVYIISYTRDGKDSTNDATDDENERGHSLIDSVIGPS